jgi:hypothetical protein
MVPAQVIVSLSYLGLAGKATAALLRNDAKSNNRIGLALSEDLIGDREQFV